MSSKSWFKFENKSTDNPTIYIYDEVSAYGVNAKDFIGELNSIKSGIINLRINSPGGCVFDGITIHNALKQHPSKVHVQVDGLAASIASVIAMAGDQVRMAKNSFMMIHNAWALTAGNAGDMRKLADTLDKIDGTLVNTYHDKTGRTEQDIKSMMAAETWMTADEAMQKGFCDFVGDPAEIKARFNLSKFANVPQIVAAMNIISKPDNERDLESILRDSGLSRKEALAAVSSFKFEAQRDAGVTEMQRIKEYMQAILKK
ncbi:MAG TPA: head maturation protease, ClpP-related [Desulfuromonadaceae bacterium]|jgi:ATP-dependent Clp protease protease subunit